MRFRSIGVCASNITDYLTHIKEVEDNYINESTLAHLGFISLKENNNNDGLLGPNSLYKLKIIKEQKRKKRKRVKCCRKKLFFYHQTKYNDNKNIVDEKNIKNLLC